MATTATREGGREPVWGLLAEFEDPEHALLAAHRCREEGFRSLEAFSPQPVDGLAEELGYRRNRMPLIVLAGGILGGLTGFFMQYIANVWLYPLDIGGRPDNSWPAFIPITFELTVLGGAISGFLGLLIASGLPRPHHPVFGVEAFRRASTDRYFLAVRADDTRFDEKATRDFLESLEPLDVSLVSGRGRTEDRA